jgi:uncharacterized protein (UPF0218 family)
VAHINSSVQLSELREEVRALKGELAEGAKSTKEELKFELMHEKSPQVATLKDFIAQQVLAGHSLATRSLQG